MQANNTQSTDYFTQPYEPRYHDVLQSWTEKGEYVVEELLGRGSYGTVLKCWSTSTSGQVAVKIAQPQNLAAAMIEARVLTLIGEHSKEANEFLIALLDVFMHNGQVCIVLETMEMSLHRYIYEATETRPLDLSEIRRILHDTLMGLIKLKEMGIIHADLKPDNIMMNNCGRVRFLRAKIIDFGLAHCRSRQSDEPHIQTLYYRSPEVIMHCLPYSEAIDVWSLGCIMGELLTKSKLYRGACEYDQMRYIVENQGLPSLKMIRQGRRSPLYFTNMTETFRLRLKTPKEILATVPNDGYQQITEAIVMYRRDKVFKYMMRIMSESVPMFLDGDDMQAELSDRLEAFNLLEALLKLDPQQRISANKAVQHPFFQMKHMQPFVDSSERVRDCFECMNVEVKKGKSGTRCNKKKMTGKKKRCARKSR